MVLHKPSTNLAIVFSRQVDDEILVFESTKDGEIRDRKSKGRWSYAGEGQSGAFAGRKLSFVPSFVQEWYVWAEYHPETEIFDAGSFLMRMSGSKISQQK